MQIGSAIQIVLLALALGDRYNFIRQDAVNTHEALHRAQKKLSQQLQLRVNLFSDVTHHLNNPLNYVKGGVISAADVHEQIASCIDSLLPPPSERSPEDEKLCAQLEEIHAELRDAHDSVDTGLARVARVAEELRGLSGIDGVGFEPEPLGKFTVWPRSVWKILVPNVFSFGPGTFFEPGGTGCPGNAYVHALAMHMLIRSFILSPRAGVAGVRTQHGGRSHAVDIRSSGGKRLRVTFRLCRVDGRATPSIRRRRQTVGLLRWLELVGFSEVAASIREGKIQAEQARHQSSCNTLVRSTSVGSSG